VQAECPAATPKCVSEFFCDENGVMVFSRVDLTPQQKKNRGTLPVGRTITISQAQYFSPLHLFPQSCTMPGTGNLGVCCAPPASPAPAPAQAQAPRPQQQFQQQAPAAK
jgi:hypothetical protein